MIKHAGFDNFRKYVHLDPLKLKGVNFLVGENNSGKSTFTKGILLLSYFLDRGNSIDILETEKDEKGQTVSTPDLPSVSFSDERLKNVYINTFYQALSSQSTNGVIKFNCRLDEFDVLVSLYEPNAFGGSSVYKRVSSLYMQENCNVEDPEDISAIVYPQIRENNPDYYKKSLSEKEASILKIKILDYKRGVLFCIATGELAGTSIYAFEPDFIKQIVDLETQMDGKNTTSIEYAQLSAQRDELYEKLLKDIEDQKNKVTDKSSCWGGMLSYNPKEPRMFRDLATSAKADAEKRNDEEALKRAETALSSYDALCAALDSFNLEYIYAHSVHQLSGYKCNSSDYVDQTISRYWNMKNCRTDEFVCDKMRDFKIGEDFKIYPKGKNLKVEILDNSRWQDLSSKGIGAIQMFLLILRIAIIIGDKEKCSNTTIIVEEPEQNLHPALQSQLADFFYSINVEYGCQFIVETHSEYLVRKTQVIVGRIYSSGNLGENPFNVIYFPKEGAPYKINYLKDGQFREDFGRGFYDESSALYFDLIKGI